MNKISHLVSNMLIAKRAVTYFNAQTSQPIQEYIGGGHAAHCAVPQDIALTTE